MYYYPSVCANMSAAACLDIQRFDRYPAQDSQETKYFVNNNVAVGNHQQSLSGQQLSQLRNHQMMNLSYGKRGRGRDDDNDEEYEFKKSISDSDISLHHNKGFSSNDDVTMSEEDMDVDQKQRQKYNPNKRNYKHGKKEVQKPSDEWPVFQHPEGGVIQFTPHGNIRTYFDNKKGVEVSVLENETNFMNFGEAR